MLYKNVQLSTKVHSTSHKKEYTYVELMFKIFVLFQSLSIEDHLAENITHKRHNLQYEQYGCEQRNLKYQSVASNLIDLLLWLHTDTNAPKLVTYNS